MTVHYADESVTVHAGDCLEVLATLPDSSVDSVVTDPPYGIRFMGKAWDGADITARTQRGRDTNPMPSEIGGPQGGYRSAAAEAGRYDLSENAAFGEWCELWARECLRILKPGGHIASFGGSRTWHRLAAAVEDAGFELRDSIAWLYGSGFPKSLDVSKAIDRAAGALREPSGAATSLACEFVRRGEPCLGHAGETATSQSGRTIHSLPTAPVTTDPAKQWDGWGTALKPAFEPIVLGRKPILHTVADNVVTHGTGALNIDACRVGDGGQLRWSAPRGMGYRGRPDLGGEPTASQLGRWPTNVVLDERAADELDQESGITRDGVAVNRNRTIGDEHSNNIYGRRKIHSGLDAGYGGEGGASRFFPTFHYEAKAPTSERPTVDGVSHPTVKPLDLMRWLVRLVTPPGGVVLDPFAGSGTTAEACVHEHMRCITIEREADYLPLIVARLTKPMAIGFDFGEGA
jgi:DNA modification methylase